MILIKSAVKNIEGIYYGDGHVDTVCTGINVICDIGEFKDCKIYIEGLTTIDETIIAKTIKKNIEKLIV